GVFDIIHTGHVGYLREAKKLGHKLLVAVNTDGSVKRLNKGPERPIFPLAERMKVLANIDAVDWVVPFSQDTPRELVEVLRPDCLVKGEDYKIHEIAGSETVLSYGGEVLSIAYPKRETSTSRIVDYLT
ncbi:MAG: adenylyltransferase/cytidyltransferase family protein, partial [Gammaproteobacteria bacterium]